METQPIKPTRKLKNFFASFFWALVLAILFLALCSPFLISANDLSYAEKATAGQINLWRIVFGFGFFSIVTTIFFLFRKNKCKLMLMFLWLFWILGTFLVLLICYKTGGIRLNADIFRVSAINTETSLSSLSILPFLLWIFGICYCREVARRLGMNTKIAILAGIFLPILSLIIYAYISFRKKERAHKIKLLKITFSAIILVSLVATGILYYIVGTPEYSLYKLKQALLNYNDTEFAKYFDTESIANNFGETPGQTMDWIIELNNPILEIKEENPDKSKDAEAFISTGLTSINLKVASVEYSPKGEAMVSLQFDDYGSKLLAKISKRNIGNKLAVYLSGQLVSEPVVQSEITNGNAVIFAQDASRTQAMVNSINTEKLSQINGFNIRKKEIAGNSAKITIGKQGNENGFEIAMSKTETRLWRINKIDTVIINDGEAKLPSPEGEKVATFSWKYKGKNYSLDEKLFDSYYKFYNSLPAGSVFNGESLIANLEKKNELFINETEEDKTINELAQSIKSLGEKNKLNENQIVELVSTFVQTIPYDTEEWENRNTVVPKVDYPYEVLYKNKGICSDKSYLAYSLLRDLGYGVSFFLFQEDQHIAIGVKCPMDYSNYDSGYCFIETTILGNKIGSTPSLSKEFGTATSKVELSDFSTDSTESEDSPLGKIEILNKIDGLVYTGVIDTFNTQKEIDNLLATIRRMDRELDVERKNLDNEDEKVGKMVDKLDKLAKSSKNGSMSAYDDYNDLYPDYKKAYSDYEKDRKAFNAKIATRNQLNDKYNNLVNSFYQ